MRDYSEDLDGYSIPDPEYGMDFTTDNWRLYKSENINKKKPYWESASYQFNRYMIELSRERNNQW